MQAVALFSWHAWGSWQRGSFAGDFFAGDFSSKAGALCPHWTAQALSWD